MGNQTAKFEIVENVHANIIMRTSRESILLISWIGATQETIHPTMVILAGGEIHGITRHWS